MCPLNRNRLAALFAIIISGSNTSQASSQTDSASDIPVVVSVSGGISLGAYEAGVNWAVVEFLRASQDPSFRGQFGITTPFRLAGATGASAGNVNGVLSAVEWCAGRARAPEESLFWTMWVQTGLEQLMIERIADERNNRAMFHREYLNNEVFKAVHARMTSGDSRSCDVPVGLALTRIRPDTVAVDASRGIWVPTQRFVAAYRVVGDGGRMRFVQPHPALHRELSTGKLIVGRYMPGTEEVDSGWVRQAVSASSAFPIAFEPVKLDYYDRDSLDTEWRCRSGENCIVKEQVFTDGGVFDINPLDLAISLHNTAPGASETDPRVRIVYIDPGHLRDTLRVLRRVAAPREIAPRGLATIGDFIGPFVSSSRSYELHSLARSLERNSQGRIQKSWLRPTSRSQPIFGEHLGAFAAFLGRPMREHDFYAGIYDGLRFVAEDMLCAAQNPRCTQSALRTMILSGRLPLGENAPRALHHFYADEYAVALSAIDTTALTMDTVGAAPGTPERLARTRAFFVDQLVRANHILLEAPRDTAECRGQHWQRKLTCTGGFGAVLDRVNTPEFRKEADRWIDREECEWEEWEGSPTRCPVEGTFVRLVSGREEFTRDLVDRLVHQLWRVEDVLGWTEEERRYSREKWIEWGELAYRGVGLRRPTGFGLRNGWDFDPSSVQTFSTHTGKWFFHFPLPYSLSIADGEGAELAYRPTLFPFRNAAQLSVITPAAFTWRSGGRFDLSAGAGLRWTTRRVLVSSVEGAWQPLTSVDPGQDDGPTLRTARTGTLGVHLVADRIRIGARYVAEPDVRVNRGRRWWWSVGIADFNGLAYWFWRTRK